MKVLTVANYKGGVAKTTTVINVSYNLAVLHGLRVLCVDADPQGNLSYFYSKKNEVSKTLYDVLMGKCHTKSAIRRTKFKNLDILPANVTLEELDGITEHTLKDKLEEVKDLYDYVIIDCQPSMQINTVNALVAADDLIVPLKIDRFGLNGLELMQHYIDEIRQYNPEINFRGCLITMYHPTRNMNKGIEEIFSKTNYIVFDTVISQSEAVNTSISIKKPLTMHRKKASATEDYIMFVNEYLQMED